MKINVNFVTNINRGGSKPVAKYISSTVAYNGAFSSIL